MTVLEIEDDNGNTIGAIRVQINCFEKGGILICGLKNLEIADEDGDYIFDTKDRLIRLQLNENKKYIYSTEYGDLKLIEEED